MFEFGAEAEDEATRILVADKWIVTPLRDIQRRDGLGPRAVDGSGQQILPDLLATKHSRSVGVEVKRKDQFSNGRLTGELEHGIDLPYFDAYLNYERRTGTATFLLVAVGPAAAHPRSWQWHIARISNLRARVSHGGGMPPMAYWPVSQMSGDWLLRLNRYIAQSGYKRRNGSDPPPDLWGS
jgi:hypothetical protein